MQFGGNVAVNDVSLSIRAGEIVGLIIDVAQHAEPPAVSAPVVLAEASSKDSPVSVVANPYMSDLSMRCGREQGAVCRTDRCIYPLSRSGGGRALADTSQGTS